MRAEPGFTLLEVLIAFVIAALALTALFQGALGGLESARVSGQYQEALSRARSHLAAIGHGSRMVAGEQQGDDGSGYRWRVRIAPVATAPVAKGDPVTVARGPRAILYAVAVTISWSNGPGGSGTGDRSVHLESRRIASAPPPPP